ncbi:MAG: GntP family permease [Fuerstiella sp.]
MATWGVLAAGLLVVVVGILRFKLHAFVALIVAAMVVALLTPATLISRSSAREAIDRSAVFDSEAKLFTVDGALDGFPIQEYLIVAETADGVGMVRFGQVTQELEDSDRGKVYGFELLSGVDSNSLAKPLSLSVLSQAALESANQLSGESCISRLTKALGSYCGKLAILIVAASIIGRCLLESGAADRVVQSAVSRVGEKNAPVAFAISGFTLSIPVFFDTVFYLMVPLAKALRLRTGKNYLLYVLATVAGGTMAHSLVPPTPGPLFIAEAFEVPLSSMILGGCLVGLISASVGMLYAVWINKRCVLELSEDATLAQEAMESKPSGGAAEDRRPPSVALALVPILLPVILIAAGAFVSGEMGSRVFLGVRVSDGFAHALKVLAEKNTALMISAAVAVVMYVRAVRPTGQRFQTVMQEAVSSAGTIILVTAAGGAFGRMMRQANVAEMLEGLPSTSPVMLVVAAFFVTTAVRTAQGSSTVAMLTSAGIFGGLVTSGAAGVDPLYVALAVGCGSKPFAWMNDSGFWVITRMSGMSESEGLRYVTPMTALAAFAGLGTVIVGVVFFP